MKTNRTLINIGGMFLAASLALAQDAPPAPPTPAAPVAVPAAQAMPARVAPAAPTAWPAIAQDVDQVTPMPPMPAPAPRAMLAPVAPAAPTAWPAIAQDDDQVTPMPPMPAAAPRAMRAPAAWPTVAPMAAQFALDAVDQVTPLPPVMRTPQAMPAPVAPPAPTPWPDVAPMAVRMAQDVLDQVTPVTPLPADFNYQIFDQVQMQMDKVAKMDFDFAYQKDWTDAQEKAASKMAEVQDKIAAIADKEAQKFALKAPFAMQPRAAAYPSGPRGSEDAMYNNGLRAIDNHQYDQALSEFNNVVARAGSRTEGALYWKAYVLNKLGKSADAQSAIDTLRKSYPNSRWLDDSKALELEVKQSKGPVSPDAESDEELKVLALNGLIQSDPDKWLPQVQKMLQGSYSPNLKRQALYVIAQSGTPKAQQLLEQIARGGNPDLQVKAIQYLSQKRNPDTPKILMEIYTSTTDPAVKRTILDQFNATRDKEHLLNIVRTEKDGTLRSFAIGRLGDVDGQPELWQIYASETTPEGKIAVLDVMRHNGNLDKLTEVARTDKDPKVRQKAIQMIATQESGSPTSTLATLYGSEQDEKVKQSIIDNLSNSRNCKPLVDVARAEKSNMQLKIRIVTRLTQMTKSCPAASDYLQEILNK